MNKFKELIEQLRQNGKIANEINDMPGPNARKLQMALINRMNIFKDMVNEQKKLMALANELQLIVDPKYKDLLETIIWEKLQQIESTNEEIAIMKREIDNIEQQIIEHKAKQKKGKNNE